MKKILIILIIMLGLAACWGGMTGAGYTCEQAAGFDLVLLLLLLANLVVIKCGQAIHELSGKGGDHYDA